MLDLLLVNPNNRIQGEFSGIEPPIWAGMAATIEQHFGKNVAILDAEAENLSIGETVNRIEELSPRVITMVIMGANPSASSTPKMPIAEQLGDILSKHYEVKFTGLHPQAFHRVGTIDYLMQNMMPTVAWGLLPMDKYRAHNWHCLDGSPRKPYGVIYTSLGCPFNCTYCNIHTLYGGQRKVWYRKPEDAIAEIDTLVNKYKVRNIKIWDEMFTLNKKHVHAICDLIIKRGYSLNMWAYARVDTINARMLNSMRLAGIQWLSYGIESASKNVREGVAKKFEQAEIVRAVEMTHDAGIHINGNFIFGLPNEDMSTMRETLDFAKELNLEYVNFYVAMPYPGSQLYKDAVEKGLPLPKSWEGYGQYSKDTLPLPTKYLSPKQIVEFRDKAFIEYFTNRSYLRMTKEKFGVQAVEHINNMLKQKIRR